MTPTKLFIHFYQQQLNQVDWLLTDDAGAVIRYVEDAPLPLQSELPADLQIIVLVPTEDTFITQVKITQLPPTRLLQAVPFAVEEQLTMDIEQLHFAMGDWQNQELPVACVAHSQMQEWRNMLAANDLQAHVLCPDVFAIPLREHTWSIVIEEKISLIRTAWQSGYAVDNNNLSTVLSQLLHEAKDKPQAIYFNNNAIEPLSFIENIPLYIKQPPQDFLINAAQFYSQNKIINLLQGQYQIKNRSKIGANWRLAGFLLIIWFALFVISHVTEYIYLKVKYNRLDNQINTLYKQAFPQATSVVSPRTRIEHELERLTTAAAGNRFLQLLAAVGNLLYQNPKIRVQELSYQNNQLTLNILADRFETLDVFSRTLKTQGFSLTQTGTSNKNKNVSTQLIVSGGKR